MATEEVGARSDEPRRRGLPARAAACALTIVAIGFALDLPQWLGVALYPEQYLGLLLALALAAVFLSIPARSADRGRVPWYDAVAAALSFAAAGWVALRYPMLVDELVYKPLDGLVIAVVLVLSVVEAARRAAGVGIALVIVLFIVYALAGGGLPESIAARTVDWDRLAIYLALDANGMLGLPLMVAGVIVIAFILLGQVLAASGGGDFFTDLALALVGRRRGGPGKIAVLASMLFGSVSGSAVANVVGSGLVTIPLMKRGGYAPHQAAAIEAVASTGGQLAPPIMGAAAFLMAEFLNIGYAEVVLAAVVPTILYYLAIFVWVDCTAGRMGLLPLPAAQTPRVREVLRSGWHFALPFVVLLAGLFVLNWAPQLAALAATATLVATACAFGYKGRRYSIGAFARSIGATGFSVLEVVVICAAAGLVIGVLNLSGLAFGLTLELARLAEGNVFVLLVVAAFTSVVLGMGMPTVGVYVLLASLIAPAMVQAGLDPVASHLFLLYFGMMSMITPPVALASFTAATLAGADLWRTGWEGMRIGWIAYLIPFVIVLEPDLTMQGDWIGLVWHGGAAIFGVVFVTMAVTGFGTARALSVTERLLLALGGLVAVLPLHALGLSTWWPNLVGLGLAGAAWWPSTRARPAAARAQRLA